MKSQATLWGPDTPIINRYQTALEARGFQVTRMEDLPDEFSWVALELSQGFYRNDDVSRVIDDVSRVIDRLEPIEGWDEDPLDL